MHDLRYPIGEFEYNRPCSTHDRELLIEEIAATPKNLHAAVAGLNREQLETPYREGGWTVRQLVHHLADTHANTYLRFKVALTGDAPLISPFHPDQWAQTPENATTPIEISLALFDAVQQKWIYLLKGMSEQDFAAQLRHPERGLMDLDRLLALYAWHGKHHVAHITSLRQRMNW